MIAQCVGMIVQPVGMAVQCVGMIVQPVGTTARCVGMIMQRVGTIAQSQDPNPRDGTLKFGFLRGTVVRQKGKKSITLAGIRVNSCNSWAI